MESKWPMVLTIKETADYLRVHASTIRRLIRSGKIPAFRVGAAWRIHKETIDAWRQEQEQTRKIKTKPRDVSGP